MVQNTENEKFIILLSGGLDSSTMLGILKSKGVEIYALTFKYGQKNYREVELAKKIAKLYEVKEHKIVDIDLSVFENSALTSNTEVPKNSYNAKETLITPITYVPGRNTIFLSIALAYAETIKSYDIFIGVNTEDYSGYPDCRIEYIKSFEQTANLASAYIKNTNKKIKIHTPLMNLKKKEIISKGIDLGVDYSLTISCYDPDQEGESCGECDSCIIRLEAFSSNASKDPIKYKNN